MPPPKNKKKVQKDLPQMITVESESDSESELRVLFPVRDPDNALMKISHDPFVFISSDGSYKLMLNGFEYRRKGQLFNCICDRGIHVKDMKEMPYEGLARIVKIAGQGHRYKCKIKDQHRPLQQMHKLFLQHYGGKCYDATEDVVPIYNTKHIDREKVQKSKKLHDPLLKDNDEIITGQMDAMNISGSSKMNKDVNKEGMIVRPDGVQDDPNGIVSEESEATAVSTSSGDSSLATSPYSSWSNRDASYAPTASSPDSSFAWGELIHGE